MMAQGKAKAKGRGSKPRGTTKGSRGSSRSRKGKRSSRADMEAMQIKNPNAAGMDIHADSHWVAVAPDRDAQPIREFSCFTCDLHTMADWLEECGITTIAMEATGVYWIPVVQVLETRGFEVQLVNAKHVKNVPGRKNDMVDCEWLRRLHTYGLLSGSFRPTDEICVLRSYWRHRDNLIRYASAHIQHMQKALTQMNVQLHRVISDITGQTGMAIIRAILAGERDPLKLARLKNRLIKNDVSTIAAALDGDYREEHLFALQQAVEIYDHYQMKIAACDGKIEKCLERFAPQADPEKVASHRATSKRKKVSANAPKFDLQGHLYRMTGRDYTRINGINVLTVHTIISEVGLDISQFPTTKQFSSWLGLCPNPRISAGRIKSSRTRKVVNRAANAFRMAAQAVRRTKSALGAYYRRIQARLGAPKAITATAHKIARIFYSIWKHGDEFHDIGELKYEEKYRERVLKNMKKRGKQMGFEVILKPLQGNADTVVVS